MPNRQIYSEKTVKIYLQILHDINAKCKDNFTIKFNNSVNQQIKNNF